MTQPISTRTPVPTSLFPLKVLSMMYPTLFSKTEQKYEKRKKEIISQLGPEGLGVFNAANENPDSIEAAFKVCLCASQNQRREIMKQYAKENKKVNFATQKEMEEVLKEEEAEKEEEKNELDIFDEGRYNNIIQARSNDPNYVVPALDPETLKQVRELERKEIALARKIKEMKPDEGVKMIEYNEWGVPKDGTDYSNFFKADDSRPADIVLKPPADYKFPQIIVDEDKEYKDLTEEEKEVRDCLDKEDEDSKEEEGEELEDDFVIKANCGIPALVDVKQKSILKTSPKSLQPKAAQAPTDKELEEAMAEYESDEGEGNWDELEDEVVEEESESEEEVPADPNKPKMTKEQIHQMLDDYIKGKDPKARKADKTCLPPENVLPPEYRSASEETAEDKEEIIGSTIKTNLKLEKIMTLEKKRQEDGQSEDSDDPELERPKQEVDIKSIANTYNNTNNRPKILADDKPAEKKHKAKPKHEDKPVDTPAITSDDPLLPKAIKDMTKEEKAKYKKEVKAKQRERRAFKKAMKEAFNVTF
eukprot:TRINITY_DN144_c0_g2_i1.p1 TRINITY_DN144_c0_g2~~TRINITY_DN144_c0_g2_i1.p1  ORF type:complete len:533 (-),score=132.00 TRINITY_DN144_c0_g2_i1:675-2273(-)